LSASRTKSSTAGLDRAAQHVQDLGGGLHAAQAALLHAVAAGQHLAHHLVEVLQRQRLDAVERGDAHQHLVALALGEELEHVGGLVELQVHQDGGDDLRVLVAQQFGHRARVHPLQALDAGDVVALQDAVDQQVGLVLAQRLAQHGLHVLVGVGHQHVFVGRDVLEVLEHAVHALARTAFMRAMVSPRRCTSLGARCLKTSDASSSPRTSAGWRRLPGLVVHAACHVGSFSAGGIRR
jgi:hypothetical protein